jgi:hypothetical protein
MFIKRETVELLRRQYPAGTRVELVRMDDPQAPPIGTRGTVIGVDDIGSIMVNWDSGGSLNWLWRGLAEKSMNRCTSFVNQLKIEFKYSYLR